MASTRPRRAAKQNSAGPRVVIYIRVSALMGRAGDTFHSPEVQERVIRAILPPDAVVVAVIQDIDVSGQTFVREGLDKVRGYAERREADAVAVADLSRLGRRVLGSLEFIAWLSDRGVSTWSAKEHIDDSPAGRFMLMVILGLAQMIGEQIGQQWAGAIAARAQKGLAHGSKPPMGYTKDPDTKLLVPDPVLAPVVREAFRMYADGKPITHIAEKLSNARGKGTALPVVKWVLSNAAYIGQVMLNGHVVVDDDGKPAAGRHEALIDEATWASVQDRRARDAKAPPRRLQSPAHSMANLARCRECGRLLGQRDEYRPGKPKIPRLMCLHIYKHFGPDRCVGVGTPKVEELEEAVLDAVRARLAKLRTEPGLQLAVAASRARSGADAAELERGLAKVRRTQTRLLLDLAEEEGDAEAAYAAAKMELRRQEQVLVRRLGEMRPAVAPVAPAVLESALAEVLELWGDADAGQRGRLLRLAGVQAVWVRRLEYRRDPVKGRVTVEFV